MIVIVVYLIQRENKLYMLHTNTTHCTVHTPSSCDMYGGVTTASYNNVHTPSPYVNYGGVATAFTIADAAEQQLRQLHERYAHLSYQRMYELIVSKSVRGLEQLGSNNHHLRSLICKLRREACVGCLHGKMKKNGMTSFIDHRTI